MRHSRMKFGSDEAKCPLSAPDYDLNATAYAIVRTHVVLTLDITPVHYVV